MTIGDIRDYLKTNIDAPRWGTGGLFGIEEKQIILYGGRAYTNPKALGQDSSYKGKGVRILIQWTKNTIESEKKAQEVYDFLFSCPEITIANKRVVAWILRDPEPIYMGQNERGIYEYVIDLEMIIER